MHPGKSSLSWLYPICPWKLAGKERTVSIHWLHGCGACNAHLWSGKSNGNIYTIIPYDILYDSEQIRVWFPRSVCLDLEQTRMETGDITGRNFKTNVLGLDPIVEGKSTNLFCNLQRGKSWTSLEGGECFMSLWHNGSGSSTSAPWTFTTNLSPSWILNLWILWRNILACSTHSVPVCLCDCVMSLAG